jgi:hypothetical protein
MRSKRRMKMQRISRMPASKALARMVATLWMSIFLIAPSHAQADHPVFKGQFTLADQVLWGNAVLQPGDYTITIGSSSMPARVSVTDSTGRGVGSFVSFINEGKTRGAGNALLLRQKRGQLCVYSLVLGDLRMALTYDRVLAREAVLDARAPQTVPMTLARR